MKVVSKLLGVLTFVLLTPSVFAFQMAYDAAGAMTADPTRPELSVRIHSGDGSGKAVIVSEVSLQSELITVSTVSSSSGRKSKSTSEASVSVTANLLRDGAVIRSQTVVFNRHMQSLEAAFGGIYNCDVEDTDGNGIITIEECEVSDETLTLEQAHESANHFNFVFANIDARDVYDVQIEVTTDASVDADNDGRNDASVALRNASLVVYGGKLKPQSL